MSTPRIPDELRRAVAADLEPVRPLPAPWARAAEVGVWAAAALLLVPVLFGVRHDAAALGLLMTWGAGIAEVMAGLLVVAVAMAEGIPGGGLSPLRRGLALLGGVAVQAGVAVLTWMRAPAGGEVAVHGGASCFAMQGMLGLPALALAAWLLVRALPVRPRWAGALAGLGAGLVADGAWHLACPVCDLRHVLIWHGGATAAMTLAGFLLGALWERRRLRRLR
jgi:hypothetical protein